MAIHFTKVIHYQAIGNPDVRIFWMPVQKDEEKPISSSQP